MQRYEEAIALYELVLSMQPDNARAYLRLCETFFQVRDDAQAVGSCDDAINIASVSDPNGPDLSRAYRQRGQIRYSRRNYEGAIEDFDQCVALGSNEIECWYIRGLAHYYLGGEHCDDAWNILNESLIRINQAGIGEGVLTNTVEGLRLVTTYCSGYVGRALPTAIPPTAIPPTPIGGESMYLRTPKRYRPGRKERHLFNLRWLWLWLLTPIVAYGGWQIYLQRDSLRPMVQDMMGDAVQMVSGGIATAVAPTPTARPDPSERLNAAAGAWTTGAIEEALNAYNDILPDVPNDVGVHYRVALGYVMDGRLDEALTAAEGAVNANPYSSDAWAMFGYTLALNDQPELGITYVLHALTLAPDNTRALAYLAYAYYEDNQIDRAFETVERALALNPESPEAYFVRGLLNHYSRFLTDDAREDYLAALQYAPNFVDAAINLAWLDWSEQAYDDAQTRLLSIIEFNPNNLDALFALGFLYYQAYGDPQQAQDYIERCTALDSENRACLFYLGNILRGNGDSAGAISAYERLIATGTENPTHYLAMARAYLDGAGDCGRAVPVLQTGYRFEQAADLPDADRLAAFTDLLSTCGSAPPGVPAEPLTPTEEAAPADSA